jgi:hypothetical protein
VREFVPTPRRLMEKAETCAHIAVFAAIAWHRNRNGLAMPGVLRVAEMARVSKPTAILAINWLREHKFLEVSQRDGHRQARSYRFPDLEETGQNETPEPVKNRHPNKTIKKRKTISSRDKREPDALHTPFKEATREYWDSKNHDVKMPWDASEGKVLGLLLKANPTLSLESFKELLRHRYRSEVNHAQRPRQWLGTVTNYAGGPLDQCGNPKGAVNGSSGTKANQKLSSATASTETALARLSAVDCDGDRLVGRATG